ncbi:MAG TPA: AAA family ATPase, partial [Clostridia bacterium]
MKINGIVLAGTNNGCGISTVMSAVIGALVKRKIAVQAFKVGPEHCDPILHTFITGKHSRNLDSCLLSEEIVSFLYERNSFGSDISVIEGAGGIFDCRGGCSTAHIARLTGAPVILVLDGSGISLTACAVLQGIISFDSEISIKGVILNNIEEKSHYEYLKELIEERTNISVLGYIPKMYDISI